jgi:uncharacterized membrane protein
VNPICLRFLGVIRGFFFASILLYVIYYKTKVLVIVGPAVSACLRVSFRCEYANDTIVRLPLAGSFCCLAVRRGQIHWRQSI